MADYIQVPADDVGKKVDAASLDVGANTVYRQRIVIGDNSATATFAVVTSGSLQVIFSAPPTINNVSATVTVAGSVGIAAGTAVIGDINAISRTVQVAVGTPFTVNNISATVVVSGQVGLTAGTAVIGDINAISRTVQVAIGTPFTVNNISAAVVIAAGSNNIGTINNISANVSVNPVNISNTPSVVLAAGTAVFGTLNNISATVNVVGVVNVSATASVILAAGTANIGTLNGISATVNASVVIRTSGGSAVEDTTNNALRVNVVAGSAGGPSVVDNATFTAGQTSVSPIGAFFDDTATTSASENAAGIVRMTVMRALHANLRLTTGTAIEDTANTALRVNVVAGGGAGGGTSMADKGTFTQGTTAGTPAMGTYTTSTASLSDGEAATVKLTPNRGFHVNLRDSAGAELGTNANPVWVNVNTHSQTAAVVIAAGTANIGTINNVSATVVVAGTVSLGAGTANIGTINNISATVVISGQVGLTAGTAVIGDLNAISRTVQVAVGTPFTVNNISATVVIQSSVTLDYNTLASADQVQNMPIFGIGIPASGGAVAGGASANPIAVVAMAGANNIGTINNISANVSVNPVNISNTPSVVLAAGTAVFGTLNNISATVQVAVGTPFTVNNISAAVVLAAGTANIGFINNISATVTVQGNINISATASVILAAGTANIGTLDGISKTVTTAVRSIYTNLSVQSASRGPRMVLASTSSNVTLVAAPGAGMAIYVTMIAASNASGSNTRGRFGTSATPGNVTMMLAASGGGFVMQMEPPWKLSTNEALVCSVKPNASEGIFNCHFFVASADAL